MSRAVQAASDSPASRWRILRQKAIQASGPTRDRMAVAIVVSASCRPSRRARLRQRYAAASTEASLRLAQLVLEGPDPVRKRVSRLGTGNLRCRLQGRQAGVQPGVCTGAGQRLDPSHARADAPLAGDDEAADLARGATVRPAAQLVGVALDSDR